MRKCRRKSWCRWRGRRYETASKAGGGITPCSLGALSARSIGDVVDLGYRFAPESFRQRKSHPRSGSDGGVGGGGSTASEYSARLAQSATQPHFAPRLQRSSHRRSRPIEYQLAGGGRESTA